MDDGRGAGRRSGGARRARRGAAVGSLALAIALSGCVTMPAGTQLRPPEPARQTVHATAWIAPVEVADPESPGQADATRDALTGTLTDFIQAAGYFSTAKSFPGAPRPDDFVLRFSFDRYVQSRRPHPLYFPGAFLTATLYIWFGGPIVNETIDLSGTLVITESGGKEVARATNALKRTSAKGLYTQGSMSGDTSTERTAFIAQLLDRAVADLARKGNES